MNTHIKGSSMSGLALRSDLHVVRKLWHVMSGLSGVLIHYYFDLDAKFVGPTLVGFGLFCLLVEFVRLRSTVVNRLFLTVGRPFLRDSEENAVSGMPFYALGAGLSLVFFPERIAILSIFFLIFADPISSFVGILHGKDKILPNKSLQGTLAGFTTCYLISLVYVLAFNPPSYKVMLFSLLGGVVGAVSELLPCGLDDNLTIPLLSGLGLYFLNLAMPLL